MQKMYGKLHDKELSANTSHANTCNRTLLCLHGTALCGSLTSYLRSSLAGFARHFYHSKAKQTPPEEGVGLLIQAECSIGVHVPGPRLGIASKRWRFSGQHCMPRRKQEPVLCGVAQAWRVMSSSCLLKLKNSICFPLCVSGTSCSLRRKYVQLKS